MADLERFKLSNIVYDSVKNLEGLFVHLDNFGSIVRSCASGYLLEDLLDSKLHRSSIHQGSVPSFLLSDPDFSGPAPMIEAINPNDPEEDDSGVLVSESAVAEDDNAFSVAAEEEYERGEYSLSELHLDSCIETLTHNDGPGQALDIAAAAQYVNATFANATFAGSTTTGRLSLISRSSASDSHNCASDWGKSNDEIDWDAITNGDINGDVD